MRYAPTIVTISNILLGIFCLYLISIGKVKVIPLIVLITSFFDFVDGYLARRLNVETKIGCILDSVSDAICFVFVPAFLVFIIHKKPLSIFLILGCLFYFFAGLNRLLRHSLSRLKSNSQNGFFLGCPVTAAALIVVLATSMYENATFHILLIFVCGYFMISRIEYAPFSHIIRRYSKEVPSFIYSILLLPFFLTYPLRVVFALAVIYFLFFPIKFLKNNQNHRIEKNSSRGKLLDGARSRKVFGNLKKLSGYFPSAKGTRGIFAACAVSFLMALLFLPAWLKVFYSIIRCATMFFFRDPERFPGHIDRSAILAPADGKIINIKKELNEEAGKTFNRVSIFLSIFDVHVNRAPATSRVVKCVHRDGRHADARHPESVDNEHYLYTLELENGIRIFMKQIAGKFARRIKSYVVDGDIICAADRMGIILFGSRVELLLPTDIELYVKVGDTVKAGITILGALRLNHCK